MTPAQCRQLGLSNRARCTIGDFETPLTFHRDAQAVRVDLPETRPCDHVFAFRINLKR
jgi:hypothetical protein